MVRPCEPPRHGLVAVSTSRVPCHAANASVYGTVESFEREMFSTARAGIERVEDRTPLKGIVNLHDDTGIRDISQIVEMIRKIGSGGHICRPSGLPNIKLVRSERGDWVLFDGHHSMLAYMVCGREYLDEVPHLIVRGEEGHVADREILVFFGAHSRRLRDGNWRGYVLNWEAPEDRQLCRRAQDNMGGLLDRLVERGALPVTESPKSGPTKEAS